MFKFQSKDRSAGIYIQAVYINFHNFLHFRMFVYTLYIKCKKHCLSINFTSNYFCWECIWSYLYLGNVAKWEHFAGRIRICELFNISSWGGGTLLSVKNNLSVKPLNIPITLPPKDIELTGLEIKLHKITIFVVLVYIRPSVKKKLCLS